MCTVGASTILKLKSSNPKKIISVLQLKSLCFDFLSHCSGVISGTGFSLYRRCLSYN